MRTAILAALANAVTGGFVSWLKWRQRRAEEKAVAWATEAEALADDLRTRAAKKRLEDELQD
jgi:sensor domain CHASE-containing protein